MRRKQPLNAVAQQNFQCQWNFSRKILQTFFPLLLLLLLPIIQWHSGKFTVSAHETEILHPAMRLLTVETELAHAEQMERKIVPRAVATAPKKAANAKSKQEQAALARIQQKYAAMQKAVGGNARGKIANGMRAKNTGNNNKPVQFKAPAPTATAAIPRNRKEAGQRIAALYAKMQRGEVLPGQLLKQKQATGTYRAGKALLPPLASDDDGNDDAIAKIAALAAIEVEKAEGIDPTGKHHHHHHHHHEKPELKKANKAQQGFMAIVMHNIARPAAGTLKKLHGKVMGAPLGSAKDVHNLLWTAVALAREKLALGKAKDPVCLLAFLGHMVGGAFAPFVVPAHKSHVRAFMQQMHKFQMAFLSSGYRHFWRKKLGEKKFEALEKKARPIFINHEA